MGAHAHTHVYINLNILILTIIYKYIVYKIVYFDLYIFTKLFFSRTYYLLNSNEYEKKKKLSNSIISMYKNILKNNLVSPIKIMLDDFFHRIN